MSEREEAARSARIEAILEDIVACALDGHENGVHHEDYIDKCWVGCDGHYLRSTSFVHSPRCLFKKARALLQSRASSQAESGEDSIADALHEAVSRYLIRNPDRNDDEALCDALNTYEGYMRSRLTPPPPSSAEEGR